MKRRVSGFAAAALAAVLLVSAPAYTVLAEEAAAGTAPAAETVTYPDSSVVKTNGVEGWPLAEDIGCDYGCLMDAVTGAVLFNKNEHGQTPPASLTKLLTALIAVEKGDLNAQVTMTETGTAFATDGSSNLYTQVGEVFTLKDLLYGTLLKSANDMATQVGEYIGGGSLETFIGMMNERAKELGCRNSNFVNACGMPAEGHVSTAYDMCMICREVYRNPTLMEILGTASYTIPATNLNSERSFTGHHPFVTDPANAYEGFLGGKTGYTDAALSTLATIAKRDTTTLICVTLHGGGLEVTSADTRKLLDYGFNNFKHLRVDAMDFVEEGGLVSIPKNVTADDLTVIEKERDDAKYGPVISYAYQYNTHTVGRSVVLKSKIDAIREAEERARQESLEELASSAAAAMSAEEVAEPGSGEEASFSAVGTGQGAEIRTGSETVTLPLGITMNRTAFIAIAALALLILLGLLIIIITLIARRGGDE